MKNQFKLGNLSNIGFGPYFALIPDEYDEELKKRIASAMASKHLRLKSMDYTKSKYIDCLNLDNGTDDNPFSNLFTRIDAEIKCALHELYEYFDSINFVGETISSLAVETTLHRLRNSYECSLLLMGQMFYFETIALIRQIFEQLAYCMNICDMTNDEFTNLSESGRKHKLRTTNIHNLKEFLTDRNIGALYSYLSQISHIDAKQIGKFISYDEQIKKVVVQMKSPIQVAESALLLLGIIDIHTVVLEYSLRIHLKSKYKYITKENGQYYISQNRKVKNLYTKYRLEFDALLESEQNANAQHTLYNIGGQ
ncbi:hypothetical protein DF185_06610 [Marinifilum breve]|uniref:Uncharacterized protein n=1 Tax=Marinifilum breve TaxID=2184082 RepID=A0A2V4AE22_9BACT|nr:hypothetical protein [Marinifilum breve]PXY02314.1 hypothetical protein DF185_06610 [Marinifilum breve]